MADTVSSGVRSPTLQGWCYRSFLGKLVAALPSGACIDLAEARRLLPWHRQFLMRTFGAARLVPVSSRATVAERLQVMRTQRDTGHCWTLACCDDDDLPDLARQIVAECAAFERVCDSAGLHVVHLPTEDFHGSIEARTAEIVARMCAARASAVQPEGP